jgi:hypothetical protein
MRGTGRCCAIDAAGEERQRPPRGIAKLSVLSTCNARMRIYLGKSCLNVLAQQVRARQLAGCSQTGMFYLQQQVRYAVNI